MKAKDVDEQGRVEMFGDDDMKQVSVNQCCKYSCENNQMLVTIAHSFDHQLA